MIKSSRIIAAAASLMCLAACSPSLYPVNVEMRYPSKSGLDLSGKTVSMVYLDNGDLLNRTLTESFADGFAYGLEQDYKTGEGSVGVYRIQSDNAAAYSCKDSLVTILMDTGSDLVFMVDPLNLAEMKLGGTTHVQSYASRDSSHTTSGSVGYSVRLCCFDAMDKTEKVHVFGGSSVLNSTVYSDGTRSSSQLMEDFQKSLSTEAWKAGKGLSSSFESQWKNERYSVFYFDNEKWYEPLQYAISCDWSSAMKMWLDLLDTKDALKRACAAYNISVACYMLGDYQLALRWVDRSDEENKLKQTDIMRKRINARL